MILIFFSFDYNLFSISSSSLNSIRKTFFQLTFSADTASKDQILYNLQKNFSIGVIAEK